MSQMRGTWGGSLWKMWPLPAASQGKWLLPVQTRDCLLQLILWEDPLQSREISGSLLMSGENRDENQRAPIGWGSLKQMARCLPTGHCAQAQCKWQVAGLCSEPIPRRQERLPSPLTPTPTWESVPRPPGWSCSQLCPKHIRAGADSGIWLRPHSRG